MLQWDKDDCAAAGLVKFDLLGLGMLGRAARLPSTWCAEHHGERLRPATIPQEDPAVYDMLCRGRHGRACSRSSPGRRWPPCRGCKPRQFYDLVVEVALIRPGPDPGRLGAPVPAPPQRARRSATYPHPLAEHGAAASTLGVPLFQEQVMQMAIDVRRLHAGRGRPAAPGDGLQARRPSAWSELRAAAARRDGRARHHRRVAEEIYEKLPAFSNYGFPESHSISFAYLVYASAWLKRHYPAAFTAALLNNQPMGFYAPHSLVEDARRHGVTVHGVDVNASDALATLEGLTLPDRATGRHRRPRRDRSRPSGWACPASRNLGAQAAEAGRGRPAPTGTWRTSPAGRACRPRRWRRWPPRGRSAASGSAGARRCGRPGPPPRSARGSCPGTAAGPDRAAAARHDPGRGDPGRPVGHRHVRHPPGRAHAGRARRPGRCSPRPSAEDRAPTAPWWPWPGWSPTGSGRRPRAG